ncbi:hypothetical protein AJ80_02450 [Polytolypa hystricis UAMH7299]|uniref:PH domain-containing protein n=1 Tax=Polytolypa hystricis (strain UAMH7299) TaxID=1447883 RepID=A0A2B7YPB8_POLH7|nr:hypothetical protein AJ80_02450 [Polytolypa hystricis UAMH7299]
MDASQQTAIGSRRGMQLHPIQTNGSVSRPERPPRPVEAANRFSIGGESPMQASPLKSQPSKTSLKSLFMRSKPSRRPVQENNLPSITEAKKSKSQLEAIPSPISASPTPNTTKSPSSATSHSLGKLSPNTSSKPPKIPKDKNEKPHRAITSWDPPPLFQAYPQAIKHATLLCPSLSAEAILRINGHRRNSSVREDSTSDVEADDEHTMTKGLARMRKGDKEKKHSRKISESLSKAEWAPKIFILVTSGYLLQYAGEGSFDRLPEKMMELGKNSAAFASDVIPGKHWVLQISQTLDTDGTVAVDTKKKFFSRFSFADSRRLTKTLLLVLNSPEELASWLVVMRREIEALGGKEYVPETPLNEVPHNFPRFRNVPSARHPPKRPQSHFSNQRRIRPELENGTPIHPISEENLGHLHPSGPAAEVASMKSANRRSIPQRPSIEAPSLSTTATSTDLDRLREGSRLSYVSIGTRTIPSSRGSSPSQSPARSSGPTLKGGYADSPRCLGSAGTPPANSSTKRQSLHTYTPIRQSHPPVNVRPERRSQSALAQRPTIPKSPPNFSVPAFSKRFSATVNPSSSRQLRSVSPRRANMTELSSHSNTCSDIQEYVPADNGHDCDSNLPSERPKGQRHASPRHSLRSEVLSQNNVSPKATPSKARRYSSFDNNRPSYTFTTNFNPDVNHLRIAAREKTPSHSERTLPQTQKSIRNLSSSTKHPDRQLRRPASMQVRPAANGLGENMHASKTMPSLPSHAEAELEQPISSVPSSSGRLSLQRSMPHLSMGPPPAPPPDCPLPEIPPIVVSQHKPAWGNPSTAGGHNGRQSRSRASTISRDKVRYSASSYALNSLSAKEASMVNAF